MSTSRYTNNKTKIGTNGKLVYRPRIPISIPLNDSDVYVATETGDRLDTLAYDYYGDSTLWWIIANANNIHDAPIALEDGTILRIPIDYNGIILNQTYNI